MENRSNEHQALERALSDANKTKVSLKSVNWLRLLSYLKPYVGRMILAIVARALLGFVIDRPGGLELILSG